MGCNWLLLVEDSNDDSEQIIRALSKARIAIEVRRAENGQDALNILRASKTLPVVALVDVNMPVMDGFEFLEEVRADPALKLIPMVMLTSSDRDIDRTRSYQCGANSYVAKPLDDREAFRSAVESLGIYWTMTNRVPY